MTESVSDPRLLWKPPPRPEWVRRLNEEGRHLDLRSVVPLDENSLLAHARANTGLHDFGGDDWIEPFRVFIRALEEESELTLMGRLMTRSDILMHLEARLRVEDTYRRHPEIDDEQIRAPIWIIGSGRCGSSAMQNLLSFDPDNATPKHWEALFPCPPPESATYLTDPRIALADARTDMWNRVTPEIASMHEFRGHMPTELIHIEAMSFQSRGFLDLYGLVPSFDAYMEGRSALPALGYAKRVLKLLQWKNPRKRWLIKSPDAMRYMTQTFEVFPDVQMVWMHRDPIRTVASFVNFIGTLFWIRSDRPLGPEAIGHLTDPAGLAGLFGKVMDEIEQGLLPLAQFHHVQYLDFVRDQLGTVEGLYRDIGIAMTDAARDAMATYLREHPRENRPPHRYGTGDLERQARDRALFARYRSFFDVPDEV